MIILHKSIPNSQGDKLHEMLEVIIKHSRLQCEFTEDAKEYDVAFTSMRTKAEGEDELFDSFKDFYEDEKTIKVNMWQLTDGMLGIVIPVLAHRLGVLDKIDVLKVIEELR